MNKAAKITGVGSYLPERVVTNQEVIGILADKSRAYLSPADLETLVSKAAHKLERAGNHTRRWCAPDQWCTDIAALASRKALERAGIGAGELDLIIFTGMSKAFVEPATAHVLRNELGATRADVIDTQDACTSFAKSLHIADSLIRAGRCERVLVAVGERTFDWADFRCKTIEELRWKFGSLTIGDAAGAVVLEATEDPVYTDDPLHFDLDVHIISGTHAHCHIGLNHSLGERYRLFSNSSALVRTAMQASTELMIRRLKREPELAKQHFDLLLFHDIGAFIGEQVLPGVRMLLTGIPEHYDSFYAETGNIASASFPIGLDRAFEAGELERGQLVIFGCPAAGVQAATLTFRY